MARPRSKPSIESVAVAQAPESTTVHWEYGQSFTFRLRRVRVPQEFRGLWELALLDDDGNIKKRISDADALNFCLDNLMGELETEGF